MSGSDGPNERPPEQAPARRGRRALFSDPASEVEGAEPAADLAADPAAGRGAEPGGEARGRRALFSAPAEPAGPVGGAGRGSAVVHCRTCLAATPVSLPGLGLSLVPSLWLPTRPWPRLMRCPACHRVSWCRIDWPFSPAGRTRSGR